MEICFLVPAMARSGGVEVVLAHARHLARDHGARVAVVATEEPAVGEDASGHLDLGAAELLTGDQAAAQTWDVVVATWWSTVAVAHRLPARRCVLFMQGFEALFYTDEAPHDRLRALAAVAASNDVVVVSTWLREIVAAIHPDARCVVASPGVDKDVFGGPPRVPSRDRLRVLVEGQPSLWFKGVTDALGAIAGMRRAPHVTIVALDPSAAEGLAADRIVGGLSATEMAELYREVDVVVKLSRFEGLGLAPLEAFHLGVPCLVTPYGGHTDYVVDGRNGLVVGFDDAPATTRALERLDADRELLARLSVGALGTAATWPDAPSAAMDFHAALTADEAQQPADVAPLLELLAAESEVGRARGSFRDWQTSELEGALRWNQGALETTRQETVALNHEIVRLREELGQVKDTLKRIHEHPAYRAAAAVRRKLPGR